MFFTQNSGITFLNAYACYSVSGMVLPFLFLHRVGKLPFIKCK